MVPGAIVVDVSAMVVVVEVATAVVVEPLAVVVVVTSPGPISRVKVRDPSGATPLEAWIVKLNAPETLGVPESTPVLESDRPSGNTEPISRENTIVVGSPLACSV